MTDPFAPLTLTPIGVVRSPYREKAEAPRQPRAAAGVRATIELRPGMGLEDAVRDLEGWDYLWVIGWFDRVDGWRPTVRPPRSPHKRGVLSTRAPRRPNPIALSVVRLQAVEGLRLEVEEIDLLDGTPVLDLKPYVPWADAIPDARTGWLDAAPGPGGRPPDPGPRWEVGFTPDAEAALAFLDARGVSLRQRIVDALAPGPYPHAYRRIREVRGGYRLAVKEWRAFFRVDGDEVVVTHLASGYRAKERAGDPALELHRELTERFPPPASG